MKTYKEFVFESKQVGKLYHFTTLKNMIRIVNNNSIGKDFGYGYNLKKNYDFISFTRNKNLYKITKIIPAECCFIINGDKLSENYKIFPYQYGKNDIFSGINGFEKIEDQFEERVQGPIKNFSIYCNEIKIIDISEWDTFCHEEDNIEDIAGIVGIIPEEITELDIINFINKKHFKIIV